MVEISVVKLTDSILPTQLLEFVSPERRVKLLNYKNVDDIKRSLIAELLIKMKTLEKLNLPVGHIKLSYNPYGKPFIDNVRYFKFNVSHSGSYVAMATSRQRIGIDIEKVVPIDMRVAKRFFRYNEYDYLQSIESESERINEFYKIWTLKESYIKAEGKGLKIPLNSFEFNLYNKIDLIKNHVRKKYFFYCTNVGDYKMSVCYLENNMDNSFKILNENELYSCFLCLQ